LVRTTTATFVDDPQANYQFTGLGAGDYRVAVDISTLPAGVTQFVDPDGFNDNETELLDVQFVDRRVDFGYEPGVPDLVPSITITPSAFDGPGDYEVLVDVIEINGVVTDGSTITLRILKDPKRTLTNWDEDGTTLPVTGVPINNADWTLAPETDDPDALVFTANKTVLANGRLTFGYSGRWNANQASGTALITVNVAAGSGGEVVFSNNTDTEKMDYSPQ
jgi:hypothetical protein